MSEVGCCTTHPIQDDNPIIWNKVSRPFKNTRYVFRTVDPIGLDLVGTMIYLGKNAGVLGRVTGTTVEFDGKKKWPIADFDAACRADADPKLAKQSSARNAARDLSRRLFKRS